MSKPLVFISHKHCDAKLATTVATWLQEVTDWKMDVFCSSDPKFSGPRLGKDINKEIVAALWHADLFLLLYTGDDRDWSYCMWECGVATDSQSPDTTFIVLQCTDDVPKVLDGTNRADVRRIADLQRLSKELHRSPGFFPSQNGAFKPDMPEPKLDELAHVLHTRLADHLHILPNQEWSACPTLRVSVRTSELDKLAASPEDAIQLIKTTAKVEHCDAAALAVFGRAALPNRPLFAFLAPHGQPWFEACCGQIASAARSEIPALPGPAIPSGGRQFLPVVSRVRRVPSAGTMEFDIVLTNAPTAGAIAVEDRMLRPDVFYFEVMDARKGANLPLRGLNKELKATGKNRVPLLDAEFRPLYVIHRSVITDFLAEYTGSEEPTVADLLSDQPTVSALGMSYATVEQGTTISQALARMSALPNCRDIFVTQDGTSSTPVAGWITNVDILKYAR